MPATGRATVTERRLTLTALVEAQAAHRRRLLRALGLAPAEVEEAETSPPAEDGAQEETSTTED
jgi:hypothetical protein